jgi:hypothetical protein
VQISGLEMTWRRGRPFLMSCGAALVFACSNASGAAGAQCGASPAKYGRQVRCAGLSLRIPDGWTMLAYRSPTLRGPVIRVANWRRPVMSRSDDSGSTAAASIPSNGVLISVMRYALDVKRLTGVVPTRKQVTISSRDIAGFEGMRAPAGVSVSFLHGGSLYNAQISFGAPHPSRAAVRLANSVLTTLRFGPATRR